MMFPMVTTCSELDDALALAADVRAELQREGASFDPDLEIGNDGGDPVGGVSPPIS
jgi:phosphoenolpyruvate-protein kinase (PTS system EI component)